MRVHACEVIGDEDRSGDDGDATEWLRWLNGVRGRVAVTFEVAAVVVVVAVWAWYLVSCCIVMRARATWLPNEEDNAKQWQCLPRVVLF